MKKNIFLLCLSIMPIISLTGCVSMGIPKVEPDPAVTNLSISERYQRYQKESLGFVGKMIVDGQGNTLSPDGLKIFLAEKKDTEAIEDLSRSYVKGGVAGLLIAGAFAWECFWLSDRIQNSASSAAIVPYAVFSLGTAYTSYQFLFNGNLKTALNTLSAVNKYNYHLRQRLGLEQPVSP